MVGRDDEDDVVSQKWSWKILAIVAAGFASDVFESLSGAAETIQNFIVADCNYDTAFREAAREIESLPTSEE